MSTPKALGLACLATLAAGPAFAAEPELETGPDSLRAGAELLNQHWSESASRVLHDQATGHAYAVARWWDIGVRVDGYLVLDGAPGPRSEVISDFETTELSARLDYLIEVENYVQILPFVETSLYPFQQGTSRFNWLGVDIWYMTPLEGIELGGAVQYNLADNGTGRYENTDDNYWLATVGAREFWQDPSMALDIAAWQLVGLANRAYHEQMTGAETQGATTFDLGARATMPLPWEEMWAYLKAENIWYLDSDDRDALYEQGRDRSEMIFAIGLEYRAQ